MREGSIIKLNSLYKGSKQVYRIVEESYEEVNEKLMDDRLFIQVTINGNKKTLNKNAIFEADEYRN